MTQLPLYPTAPAWMNADQRMALQFAAEAHQGQVRKYTGEPYIYHPLHVAELVHQNCPSHSSEMIMAALLHDTVEDTEVTFTEIEREFGEKVANLVYWLTDNVGKESGNRRTRKRLACVFLSAAPVEAQIIKLCDLMSNTESIVEHDSNFARVYLQEKEELLTAIAVGAVTRGDWAPSRVTVPGIHRDFHAVYNKVYDSIRDLEARRQDVESV